MKLVGLTICRNEAWIIGLTARAALQWVDQLVILDHASTDATPDILADIAKEHPGRVHLLKAKDPAWHEMPYRQRTLAKGRKIGGTHFAICDADELLTGNFAEDARTWFKRLKAGRILRVPMLAMWRSLWACRQDASVWSRARLTLGFKDKASLSWRAASDGYQFHSRAPGGCQHASLGFEPVRDRRDGGVMHLQFVDRRRLEAKHAWYKMYETVTWPKRMSAAKLDAKYSEAVNPKGVKIVPAPARWWARWRPLMKHLDLQAPDWHRDECRQMLAEHGEKKFRRLELWGAADADPADRHR